jgi:hypothetical protein
MISNKSLARNPEYSRIAGSHCDDERRDAKLQTEARWGTDSWEPPRDESSAQVRPLGLPYVDDEAGGGK